MSTHPILLTRVLITAQALNVLAQSNEGAYGFLCRHFTHDWGDLSPEERRANTLALVTGKPLTSKYTTWRGDRFWIVTEADRSSTLILLPQERPI